MLTYNRTRVICRLLPAQHRLPRSQLKRSLLFSTTYLLRLHPKLRLLPHFPYRLPRAHIIRASSAIVLAILQSLTPTSHLYYRSSRSTLRTSPRPKSYQYTISQSSLTEIHRLTSHRAKTPPFPRHHNTSLLEGSRLSVLVYGCHDRDGLLSNHPFSGTGLFR
jgi:hypothetical protein